MPKVWNVGNTTVRNPRRIEKALEVFSKEGFSGNAAGKLQEAKIHAKLKEYQLLDFKGKPSDFNGRKWRAVLYQSGFITGNKYKINDKTVSSTELLKQLRGVTAKNSYEITDLGEKLLKASQNPIELEELYTRHFCCYELPSSLHPDFSGGKMKPFILFLDVLLKLHDKSKKGLNKFETGLFIQKFRNHDKSLATTIYNEVVDFRNKLAACKNTKEEKKLRQAYLNDLAKFSGIKAESSVKDYADTTFRYFGLSGLFAREGETIVIRKNKINFVRELLKKEPIFVFNNNPINYFETLYSNSYQIPTDNAEVAIDEINQLKASIRNQSSELLAAANKINKNAKAEEIKALRQNLIQYNNWEAEEDYAKELQSATEISKSLSYLRTLNSEKVENKPDIQDAPAYLEWSVWRSILAINDLACRAHETRRFPVDQDFLPRNTAPGGGSDLIFHFKDYILVVEVTLTKSHRQMAVEHEPVKRHTNEYVNEFKGKDVYCIFIAPEIDNNITESFRSGTVYEGETEKAVRVVPINLKDFIFLIDILLTKKFHNNELKDLLDECLTTRSSLKAPAWKKAITSSITTWKNKIIEAS